MTLTTHIVVAAAAASPFFPDPMLSFSAGVMSHFLIDAIPHWDWKPLAVIREVDKNSVYYKLQSDIKYFIYDFLRVFLDIALGLMFTYIVASSFLDEKIAIAVLLAAFGGVLPDGLQFLYFLKQKEPLATLQRFHEWIHSSIEFPPKRTFLGILCQVPIAVLALVFLRLVLVFS